jgi:hypothetical protein
MKLPAAAYSAEVATSATKFGYEDWKLRGI